MTAATAPGGDVAGPLASVVAAALGRGAVEVHALVRLPGGASRETWSFTAVAGDGSEHRLVLQRPRPAAVAPAATADLEPRLVRAAAAAGVPVPELVCASGDEGLPAAAVASLGGSFSVARHVEGETIPRRILRDGALASARAALVEQCGAALAAVHRIPPERVPGLDRSDPVVALRALADLLHARRPAFELALRWLAEHEPPGGPEVVVHGDFRLGNLVVGPAGLRAVLDWELAHLSRPGADLGWLCVPAWRFRGAGPVAGLGERDELLAAYAAAGGEPVTLAELRWWEVHGMLRWGLIAVMQAQAHRSGAVRSVELAAIGRRVCEAEHDLLAELAPDLGLKLAPDLGLEGEATPAGPAPAEPPEPGEPPPHADRPDGAVPGRDLHGVPSALELLEAVEGFLRDDVVAGGEGRAAFHARVAANVVAMVRRELTLGEDQVAAHGERLARLGVTSDAGLAGAIRRGELDGRRAEVASIVAESVAARLAVANPAYGAERPIGVGRSDTGHE